MDDGWVTLFKSGWKSGNFFIFGWASISQSQILVIDDLINYSLFHKALLRNGRNCSITQLKGHLG